MADFGRSELDQALDALGLRDGDLIFGHSNIGFFGRPEGVHSGEEAAALFHDAIRERIGPTGTLVVPTFTYSFPRHEVFDPLVSASRMGLLAEWVRKRPDARRSLDPCYSVAAVGACAEQLTADATENSFGPRSFFHRFLEMDGRILNLNFDAGSTFVHYVERELAVPYRFDKTFTGSLRIDGAERSARSTIWVRYLSDDSLEAKFETLDLLAREQGLFRTIRLGRGEMGVMTAADCFGLIARTLPKRPYFLTRAEAVGITEPVIVPEVAT